MFASPKRLLCEHAGLQTKKIFASARVYRSDPFIKDLCVLFVSAHALFCACTTLSACSAHRQLQLHSENPEHPAIGKMHQRALCVEAGVRATRSGR